MVQCEFSQGKARESLGDEWFFGGIFPLPGIKRALRKRILVLLVVLFPVLPINVLILVASERSESKIAPRESQNDGDPFCGFTMQTFPPFLSCRSQERPLGTNFPGPRTEIPNHQALETTREIGDFPSETRSTRIPKAGSRNPDWGIPQLEGTFRQNYHILLEKMRRAVSQKQQLIHEIQTTQLRIKSRIEDLIKDGQRVGTKDSRLSQILERENRQMLRIIEGIRSQMRELDREMRKLRLDKDRLVRWYEAELDFLKKSPTGFREN